MAEEEVGRKGGEKKDGVDETKTTLGPRGRNISTAEALQIATQQLRDLQVQAAAEAAAEMAQREAAKPPLERRVDKLERIIEHLNTQIKKLSGHGYESYVS